MKHTTLTTGCFLPTPERRKVSWHPSSSRIKLIRHYSAPATAAAAAKSPQSCPTLCDPTDGSLQGSSVPGILQARTLEWVAISFSNEFFTIWYIARTPLKNTKQLEYVKRTQRNRGKKSDMNRKVWYGKEYVRAGNSWVKKKSMAKRSARMLKEVLGLENKDKPSLLCITISFMIRHRLS